eukprot:gene14379-15877_t
MDERLNTGSLQPKENDDTNARSRLKNNIFTFPGKTVSPLGQTTVSTPAKESPQFRINKVTAVRPIALDTPSFDRFRQHHQQKIENNENPSQAEDAWKNRKSLKSTFKTVISEKGPPTSSPACRFVSVMDPVRRLPRSSELRKSDKQLASSKENINSSTDSLNEGSQKKARLKIPKPAKHLAGKSKSEEKKKKDDTNNNSKQRDFLERPVSRLRKSMGRRQSSKDVLGVDQLKASSLTRQESKDLGRASPAESPTKERAGSLRLQGRKQVSFDEATRDKPRTGSNVSSPSYEPAQVKMRPRRNTERIMRDYRLSTVEVQALKCLMEKVDLFDDQVRDTVLPLVKENVAATADSSADLETLSDKVVKDAEKESLKEKLFLSRKELDSYISFCKKMEREKRQTISEKEDLVTKTQWLDKRMTLIENENKALKIERAELLNQVYRLRCPTNVPIAERGRLNQKSVKESDESQSDVELSKQKLLYEADAFSQERAKMIKERQRLDEEVRKVQIRCVSLLAQLQHSEKTVDDLRTENEELKSNLDKSASNLMNEHKLLQDKIKDVEDIIENSQSQTESDVERRMSLFLTNVKDCEADKFKLTQEASSLKRKSDEVMRDNRLLTEEKLNLEYELMALRDSLKCDQKAKNECEVKLAELDTKLHHQQAELKLADEKVDSYEKEIGDLVDRIDDMNAKIAEMQRNEVEIESDRVAFEKFIEMLSLEMEEKLGEEVVSTDTEATSLQNRADQLGKQISAHLTPNRKIQESCQDLKEELDDIKQENKALKYAMSCRMEIQNMRATQQVECDCSAEKEIMRREMEEAASLIDHLEDEVKRLHDDKQSLLLSFLNLQAASRSREPSRTGTDGSGEEDSGDMSDAEDEEHDESENEDRYNSDLTDEEDEVSDDDRQDDREEDQYNSDTSGQGKRSLKKALSLPVEALRLKAKDVVRPSSPSEIIANLEGKLDDMKKTKEIMEEERLGLLDTVCKQDKEITELRTEVEKLEEELDEVQENDASLSQGESCANCIKSSNEIRQYLGIIQSLTEDKLSLQKSLSDIRHDKEQLQAEVEATSQEKFAIQTEFDGLKRDMDETSKKFHTEIGSMLQNMKCIEQENKTLEEHLEKVRQNKLDLLGDLKVTDQDRLSLVKSIKSLNKDNNTGKDSTAQKDNAEGDDDCAFAKARVSDEEAKPIVVEDYIEEKDDDHFYTHTLLATRTHQPPRRSLSTGDDYATGSFTGGNSTARRYAQEAMEDLQNEVGELELIIVGLKRDNRELRKAVVGTEALLDIEQAAARKLERQLELAQDEVRFLRDQIERIKMVDDPVQSSCSDSRKQVLEPLADNSARGMAGTTRHSSLTDLSTGRQRENKRPRRKISAPLLARGPSVAQAKTLCFQIAFNGMTLMEKTDFRNQTNK